VPTPLKRRSTFAADLSAARRITRVRRARGFKMAARVQQTTIATLLNNLDGAGE